MEVRPQTWELTQERYGLDAHFQRTAVAERVAYIAGRLGVPLLDLTGGFGLGFPSDLIPGISDGQGWLQRLGVKA